MDCFLGMMPFHPRRFLSFLFPYFVLLGCQFLVSSCASRVRVGKSIPQLEQVLPEQELRPAQGSVDFEDAPMEASGLEHSLRGAYFIESRRFEDAVDELRLALIYFPDSAFLHQQLSAAWLALGDYSKSKHILETGLKRMPSSPLLNYRLGLLLHREMKFQNATHHLEIASQNELHHRLALPLLVSSQLHNRQEQSAANHP